MLSSAHLAQVLKVLLTVMAILGTVTFIVSLGLRVLSPHHSGTTFKYTDGSYGVPQIEGS